MPSAEEQARLAKHIEHETAGLSKAIDRAQREIALLREYRTRLIADVVTGKLDVRGAAKNLPDEVGEPEPLEDTETLTNREDAVDEAALEAALEEAEA